MLQCLRFGSIHQQALPGLIRDAHLLRGHQPILAGRLVYQLRPLQLPAVGPKNTFNLIIGYHHDRFLSSIISSTNSKENLRKNISNLPFFFGKAADPNLQPRFAFTSLPPPLTLALILNYWLAGRIYEVKKQRVHCPNCKHFGVTWDPASPYRCRAWNITSKWHPAVAVHASSGLPCQLFERKQEDKTKKAP